MAKLIGATSSVKTDLKAESDDVNGNRWMGLEIKIPQLSFAPPSMRARRLSTVAPGCMLGLGGTCDALTARPVDGTWVGAGAFDGVEFISAGAVVPRTPRGSSTSSSLELESPLLPVASDEGRIEPRSSSELFLPSRLWNLGAGRLAGDGEL